MLKINVTHYASIMLNLNSAYYANNYAGIFDTGLVVYNEWITINDEGLVWWNIWQNI